jgi:alkylation response protein AidB-like acyl-CoA dehydrogenase
MILLARTAPAGAKKSEGLSIFLVDLREAIDKGLTVRPIDTAREPRHERALLRQPRDSRREPDRREGRGFRYILDGLNAERAIIAAECIGDAYWFLDRVTGLREDARGLSGGRSGRTRACKFPIAEAFIETGGREPHALPRVLALRLGEPVREGSEHGEVPRGEGLVGSGQRVRPVPRRIRLRSLSTTSSASFAKRAFTRSRRSPPI